MEIKRITIGETNCYLLPAGENVILIDPGPAVGASAVVQFATDAGVRPRDIKLIFITHGHFDHYGAASAIQDWCRAPIGAHPDAPAFSQKKRNALPPAGTLRGSVIRWIYLLASPLMRMAPLKADLALHPGDSLAHFGLPVELQSLPGHSPDSLGFVTPDGDAFVGDLFVNYTVPSQPLYQHDQKAWQESSARVRALAPNRVYVGHGEPFAPSQLGQIRPSRYQLRWWVR